MNILLVVGGWSPERDVSLNGAKIIHKSLLELGHTTTFFDLSDGFEKLLEQAEQHDFAFVNLHGIPGEDGLVQALLDTAGCPYQGSDARGSLLALNKSASKALFRKHGFATPEGMLLTSLPETGWQPDLAYPLFVKSNTGGSSLGMEHVLRPEDLDASLQRLFKNGGDFLVESAVTGLEITCGVLGNEALPLILIKPKHGDAGTGQIVFDYISKYTPGMAEEICPAPLPEGITKTIQELALKAHVILGLDGYSRTDFILTEDNTPVVLETNTLPGMTATSLVPREAATIGLSYAELIARLIELGLARKGSKA